ncbi:MAG: sugar-binding domain-containing protein, partial [Ferruginibacter sp.]
MKIIYKRQLAIVLILLVKSFASIIYAQNLITNTFNRNTTTLNGIWNYIVDPYETGYTGFHGEVYDKSNPNATSAFFNNYHAKNKLELVEYDFDKSPTIHVPGDWNTQKENLLYYEGTVWYKKSFNYLLKNNSRVFIYFGAVNYKAEVYLNGKKLGIHEGGFTPFNFEITNLLIAKDNYLVVKVNNNRNVDAVPTLNTDWWNYGGITRDVILVEEPNVFIEDYLLQLKKGNSNRIAGSIKLNNLTTEEKVIIQIPELKIEKEIVVTNSNQNNFEIEVPKTIKYWNTDSPKLYYIVVKTNAQIIKDKIGF